MQGAQIRGRSKARHVAIEHRQLTDIPVRWRIPHEYLYRSAIQHQRANLDVRRPSESVWLLLHGFLGDSGCVVNNSSDSK